MYYARYSLRIKKNRLSLEYSNLILKIVQENNVESVEFQSNAIKAIAMHNLNHRNATSAERDKFHKFCSISWCKYLQDKKSI